MVAHLRAPDIELVVLPLPYEVAVVGCGIGFGAIALSIVPAIKRQSHLPVVVDPSHATGHAYMVPAMAKAAIAAGADGLLIEVHPDPEHALTDGAQSVTPKVFAEMMRELARVAAAVDRSM